MITFSSCSFAVKKMVGLKSPKVQTKESVTDYLKKAHCPFNYGYILKGTSDSLTVFTNIMKGFGDVELLFGNDGIRYCYKGTETCIGVQLRKAFLEFHSNYFPCIGDTNSLDSYLSILEPLNSGSDMVLEEPVDYYMLVYWSRFSGSRKRLQNDFEWMNDLKAESDLKLSIVLVNVDMQADWGLKAGKKMKMKFRLLGKRSGSLEFGEIPQS
jgi:hypothetical protein